jgi:GYF domain 2
METLYRAALDGEDKGPFTFGALLAMEQAGRIEPETLVRRSQDEEWTQWKQVSIAWSAAAEVPSRPSMRSLSVLARPSAYTSGGAEGAPPTLAQIRGELRAASAYSGLRLCFTIIFYSDIIGALLAIYMAFESDHVALYITLAAYSLLALIPLSMSNAFLDICDSQLQRGRK